MESKGLSLNLSSNSGETMTEPFLAALAQLLGPKRVRTGEPLARHTFYRIGGPAEVFVSVKTARELASVVALARENGVSHFILGAGTNILVSDRGVRGLVVKNQAQAVTWSEKDDEALVTVESGASLSLLARQAARRGWAGLTWACGIPGTVGGGVMQNAGAHDGCIADVLQNICVLDEHNARRHIPAKELELAYRDSILKKTGQAWAYPEPLVLRPCTCRTLSWSDPVLVGQDQGRTRAGQVPKDGGRSRWVVLSAEILLRRGEAAELAARITEHQAWRRVHQPTGASCGSVFKNPPGDYAGRLVEAAGLKGERAGGAKISSLHANFFVNTGGATAADVMDLIERARHKVRGQFGVTLELEVELVGEWAE
jgi:UDP-N-acetylmuramate dehydrogenase